jgi:dCTP deaminase
MILSDHEIQALLDNGDILIEPPPAPNSDLWSSTALDLTLDGVLLEWHPQEPAGGGPVPPIMPHQENFNVQGMMENSAYATRVTIHPTHGYILGSRGFVLGYTKQKVRFPHRCRLAARVEGKSSLARLGLGVHVTAPTIHAGFGHKEDPKNKSGTPIQLEIFNLGPWPIKLEATMRICQLMFEEVRETPRVTRRSQFNAQQPFTVEEPPPKKDKRKK